MRDPWAGTLIDGYCPMGCGETLQIVVGGLIECSMIFCPRPDAVARILDDPETEHIVELHDDGYSIKHPLRERLDDALLDCGLLAAMPKLAPAFHAGRYHARRRGMYWDLAPL